MLETKRWDSIDFIKGIACILVVLIHFNFPGSLGVWARVVGTLGVPIFFLVSGYFLGWIPGKMLDANKIVRKIKHIFVIIIGASITYAIFTVLYRWIIIGEIGLRSYILGLLSPTKVINFFVTNDPFAYSHLWFLFALIYCYLFVMFIPFKSKKVIGIVGVGFMVTFLLLTVYNEWFPIPGYLKVPDMELGCCLFNLFLFRGLGFFLIGMLFSACVEQITTLNISNKLLVGLVVVGCGLAVFEHINLKEAQFYLGTYLALFAVTIWAIRNPQGGNNYIRYIGRELSLYIYVLHVAVGKVITWILNKNFGEGQGVNSYFSALLILGTSILVAFGVNEMRKKIKTLWTGRNKVVVIEG